MGLLRAICSLLLTLWMFFSGASAVMAQTESSPTLTTDQLLQRAEQLWQQDIDSAITLTKAALYRFNQSNKSSGVARCHFLLGKYFLHDNNFSTAYRHLHQSADIYHALGDQNAEADALHKTGLVYSSSGQYPAAVDFYEQALVIQSEVGDLQTMPKTLSKLSNVYRNQEKFLQADSALRRAYQICLNEKNTTYASVVASNLSSLMIERNALDSALMWNKRALDHSRKTKSAHARALVLLDRSRIYRNMSSYERAEKNIRDALDLARGGESDFLIGHGYEELAEWYRSQNEWDLAASFYSRSLSTYRGANLNRNALSSGRKLAQMLLKTGALDSCITLTHRMAGAMLSDGRWELASSLLHIGLEASRKKGDLEQLASFQSQLLDNQDSLQAARQQDRIKKLETQHALIEKKQQIELAEERERRHQLWRNSLIGGILLLLIAGGLLVNRQRLKMKKKEADLEISRLEKNQLEQENNHKAKQLTTHALHMVQKNNLLEDIQTDLQGIERDLPASLRGDWNKVLHRIDYSFSLDEDWEEFKLYFEEVHDHFFDVLRETGKGLRPNDFRIAALARLNLSIKQMASLLHISPDSVKVARYRLRKKLPIETEEDLNGFLARMDQ